MMRIEEAFRSNGVETSDSAFRVACGVCSTLQTLAECSVRVEGERSEYVCSNACAAVLVMIGPSSAMPGGFPLGEYLVQPMGEMWMGGRDAAG